MGGGRGGISSKGKRWELPKEELDHHIQFHLIPLNSFFSLLFSLLLPLPPITTTAAALFICRSHSGRRVDGRTRDSRLITAGK